MAGIDDTEIEEAVTALEQGGTVIYPTETCYGLGSDALDEQAVEQVYTLKERPREKKLTTVVSDLDMAREYCHLGPLEERVCRAFMPGPLTLIAKKRDTVPDILNDRFAFRVSSRKVCQELPRRLGSPVVATSANISGNPSSYTVADIDRVIRDRADAVLDAGRLEERPSSTVIDLEGGEPTVYREGPITRAEILEVIQRG
ncbi:MAG: L-threonylcarbamoyladenylate synthase [Candidatus Nanohaloarchaea archaeon]|nr:L-threonylcarbamoyladenylate synthase [Candidatus Nanohaloarchaea archaeon]